MQGHWIHSVYQKKNDYICNPSKPFSSALLPVMLFNILYSLSSNGK